MSAEFHESEDCMGHSNAYWREWLTDIEGNSVLGVGATKEQAEEDAKRKRDEQNAICRMSTRERLHHIVTKQPGENCVNTMSQNDMEKAIRLMAELVLEQTA